MMSEWLSATNEKKIQKKEENLKAKNDGHAHIVL